jgi:hypothetical protein
VTAALALGISLFQDWPIAIQLACLAILIAASFWLVSVVWKQFKFFRAEPNGPITSWHFAAWNLKNYDAFLDNKVRYAREALAIDEARKSFPRVIWGRKVDQARLKDLKPAWLKQVWFPGNHSDIGGSYPEVESRLSDISGGLNGWPQHFSL